MGRSFLILLLLVTVSGYSQKNSHLHFGETSRQISAYYKEKGYKIEPDKTKTSPERLIIDTNDFELTFLLDFAGTCDKQEFKFKNNAAYKKMCDFFKIDEDFTTVKAHLIYKVYVVKKSLPEGDDSNITEKMKIWPDK